MAGIFLDNKQLTTSFWEQYKPDTLIVASTRDENWAAGTEFVSSSAAMALLSLGLKSGNIAAAPYLLIGATALQAGIQVVSCSMQGKEIDLGQILFQSATNTLMMGAGMMLFGYAGAKSDQIIKAYALNPFKAALTRGAITGLANMGFCAFGNSLGQTEANNTNDSWAFGWGALGGMAEQMVLGRSNARLLSAGINILRNFGEDGGQVLRQQGHLSTADLIRIGGNSFRDGVSAIIGHTIADKHPLPVQKESLMPTQGTFGMILGIDGHAVLGLFAAMAIKDIAGKLTFFKTKTSGANEGAWHTDEAGVRWYVKPDSPTHGELQTAAEVISSRIYRHFGYEVPDIHLVVEGGRRSVAARNLGEGNLRNYSTNPINTTEFRCMRLVAAYLKDWDRFGAGIMSGEAPNMMDKGNNQFALFDFGGSLGSTGTGGHKPGTSFSDPIGVFENTRHWHTIVHEGFDVSTLPDDHPWRQLNSLDTEAILHAFRGLTDETITAIVDEARYSSRKDRNYMIDALKNRRDGIIAHLSTKSAKPPSGGKGDYRKFNIFREADARGTVFFVPDDLEGIWQMRDWNLPISKAARKAIVARLLALNDDYDLGWTKKIIRAVKSPADVWALPIKNGANITDLKNDVPMIMEYPSYVSQLNQEMLGALSEHPGVAALLIEAGTFDLEIDAAFRKTQHDLELPLVRRHDEDFEAENDGIPMPLNRAALLQHTLITYQKYLNQTDVTVIRGEARHPSVIRAAGGFISRGANPDLSLHVEGTEEGMASPDSFFVATTMDIGTAAKILGDMRNTQKNEPTGNFIYEIQIPARRGINVDAFNKDNHGTEDDHSEHEIAVPDRIPFEWITHCWEIVDGVKKEISLATA